MKKVYVLLASFVFILLAPLFAYAGPGPGPGNPPVPVPPDVPLQRVELRCNAGERVCDFRIALASGGNVDVVVRRVGQLPRRPPRIIRVPGPVRRIVRTVTPPPRIITRTRTIRPDPRVITRTRTRTRTVTQPPVTVTENAGPPIINRPRPRTTITVTPPPVQSTADAPGLPRPVRTITVTQLSTPRATKTNTEIVAKTDERFFRIPVLTAATVSIGLVILGIALALLALYAVYVIGYKQGEGQDARNFSTLLRDIRRE